MNLNKKIEYIFENTEEAKEKSSSVLDVLKKEFLEFKEKDDRTKCYFILIAYTNLILKEHEIEDWILEEISSNVAFLLCFEHWERVKVRNFQFLFKLCLEESLQTYCYDRKILLEDLKVHADASENIYDSERCFYAVSDCRLEKIVSEGRFYFIHEEFEKEYPLSGAYFDLKLKKCLKNLPTKKLFNLYQNLLRSLDGGIKSCQMTLTKEFLRERPTKIQARLISQRARIPKR